jgi:hypothetical protein
LSTDASGDAHGRDAQPDARGDGGRGAHGRDGFVDLKKPGRPTTHSHLPDVKDQLATAGTSRSAFTQILGDHIAEVHDEINKIWRELGDRPDKSMVERLFEKFKEYVGPLRELIAKGNEDAKQFATREELRRLEEELRALAGEREEAAAAKKSSTCLSCGRPYRTVTGAIQDEETLAVLGAAPISHLTNDTKPCFVYGSDHELYYSSSPRGKAFVAPPQNAPKPRPK